jgi:hypothetical protein
LFLLKKAEFFDIKLLCGIIRIKHGGFYMHPFTKHPRKRIFGDENKSPLNENPPLHDAVEGMKPARNPFYSHPVTPWGTQKHLNPPWSRNSLYNPVRSSKETWGVVMQSNGTLLSIASSLMRDIELKSVKKIADAFTSEKEARDWIELIQRKYEEIVRRPWSPLGSLLKGKSNNKIDTLTEIITKNPPEKLANLVLKLQNRAPTPSTPDPAIFSPRSFR